MRLGWRLPGEGRCWVAPAGGVVVVGVIGGNLGVGLLHRWTWIIGLVAVSCWDGCISNLILSVLLLCVLKAC